MASEASTSTQPVQSAQPWMQPAKLLTLPVELLDIIFWMAYPWRYMSGPICRDLLRYWDQRRRRSFRRVQIGNLAKLSSFHRSYAIRTSICGAFESFTVAPGKDQPADVVFDLAAGLPPALVSFMPSLQRLELHGSRVVGDFLEQAAAAPAPILPVLSDVTLVANLVGQSDPYHPALLCGLGALARLHKLHLDLDVADGNLGQIEQHVPYSCAALRELTLVHCKSSLGANDFIERCTQLADLTISSRDTAPVSTRFLSAVGKLGTVTRIHLSSSSQGRSWKLLKSLKTLSELKTLILGAGCVCDDAASFDILRLLPITRLEFQLGTVVSASRLLKLIDGVDKHPYLESLVLDQVHASLGGIDDLSRRYEQDLIEEWLYNERWTFPEWTTTFSRNFVVRLINTARTSGVTLSGGAVEAVEIETQIAIRRYEVEEYLERGGWTGSDSSDDSGW
ncbi:hypothetical protein JCM3775_006046 [Rhodotorula graminis]